MNDFLLLFIHVILSMVLPAGLSLTVGGGVNYRIVILSYLRTVCVWRNPFRFVVLNDTNVFRIHCDGPRDKDAVPTCSLSSIRFGGQKKMVPVTAKKREEEEKKKNWPTKRGQDPSGLWSDRSWVQMQIQEPSGSRRQPASIPQRADAQSLAPAALPIFRLRTKQHT